MVDGNGVAIVGAFVMLFVGVQLILNAERTREKVSCAYKKHPFLYRLFFFGDWLPEHPRAHAWFIRLGGLWFVLGASLLFFVIVFGRR